MQLNMHSVLSILHFRLSWVSPRVVKGKQLYVLATEAFRLTLQALCQTIQYPPVYRTANHPLDILRMVCATNGFWMMVEVSAGGWLGLSSLLSRTKSTPVSVWLAK